MPTNKKENNIVERNDSKKPKWKKRLFWTVLIVLIVGVLALTLYNDLRNPAELSATMYHAFRKYWWFLLLAAVCMALVFVARALKYSIMMHFFTGKARFLICVNTVIIGRFYDCITPVATGGQPFQIRYLQKKGIPDGATISMPAVEYIVSRLSTVFLSILAVVLCAFTPIGNSIFGENIEAMIAIYIAASFGILVNLGLPVLLFLSLFSRKVCSKVTRFVVNIAKFFRLTKDADKLYNNAMVKLEKNIECMKLILRKKRLMLLFVFSIGAKIALASVGYFAIKAFGWNSVETPEAISYGWGWVDITVINILIQSAVTWFPTPGNAGAAEGWFYVVFNRAIPGAGAIAMLIWRFLTYYSTIILGFFVQMLIKRRDRGITKAEHTEKTLAPVEP